MIKMKLPKIVFSKYDYPSKLLLIGNEDVWNNFCAVVEDLTPEQMSYKHSGIKQRSIAEIVNHALDCQNSFYTKSLVLGKKYEELKMSLPKTAKKAQKSIVEVYKRTLEIWEKLDKKDFQKEIKTEWGQVLTGELALFQSVTHTAYHLSEICFLRGLGGFPTNVMG